MLHWKIYIFITTGVDHLGITEIEKINNLCNVPYKITITQPQNGKFKIMMKMQLDKMALIILVLAIFGSLNMQIDVNLLV